MDICNFDGDEAYEKLIRDHFLTPLSYKDVAEDWERNSKEWYHALIAIEDLPIVLAIPELKIYAWCRCKVVANDGSEAHLHWHGLVHFPRRKLKSWRDQARRVDVKFKSTKNTFKKIKCLDHAVGVLRYLACKDGQRAGRRDRDGLQTHPHTHFSRQPIDETHRHARGSHCGEVCEDISHGIAEYTNWQEKSNWDELALHDFDACLCDRGKVGLAKKKAANEKRKAYYQTPAGIETKKKYRERANVKRQIINQLQSINVSSKAELSKETIENLIKLL